MRSSTTQLRHHPRYGGSGQPIPGSVKSLIVDWVEQIRMEGIVSIVSFMHDRDLRSYREIDFLGLDLLGFLESEGFRVGRLPWEDPAHSKTESAKKLAKLQHVRKEALAAYDRLPTPVLLMCSAGIYRERSLSRSTKTWSGGYSSSTTDRYQAVMVLRGSPSSGTLRTVCGPLSLRIDSAQKLLDHGCDGRLHPPPHWLCRRTS